MEHERKERRRRTSEERGKGSFIFSDEIEHNSIELRFHCSNDRRPLGTRNCTFRAPLSAVHNHLIAFSRALQRTRGRRCL